MRRALTIGFLLTVLAAPSAWARDPIVPLQEIHRGMTCTARTVVQGTTISDFDVEVLDVLADADGSGPRILVRVSGPAVDRTGIAEGFSGSPVYCTGANGTVGNAGAISATIGQYGADVGLVTPIELMLGLPADPPVKTRVAPKLLHAARPLASPLVIAGLSPSLGNLVEHVARAQGRSIVAAPAGPLGTFPPQELVPGASLAATLSSGAVTAGAVGTVTYRDGATVYGFGHGFDAAGRRALQLADAYVFTVVGNPLDTQDAVSYKLAAPGHPLGVLTNDAPAGVVGILGGRPRTIPLTVTVRDLDRGTTLQQRTGIVDESAVENPSGTDLLSAIAPLAVAQGITTAFNGSPSRDQPASLAVPMAMDVERALSTIGSARFATLHVERVSAGVEIERGAAMAHLLDVSGPRKVRPGQRVRVAMRVRVDHGPIRTLHPVVRIPHDVFGGSQLLAFRGSSIDIPSADAQNVLMAILQLLGGLPSGGSGAQQLQQVIGRFERVERYDGVRARLGFDRWRVYRDPALRIDGSASLPVRVVGTKRRAPHGGGGGLGQIFAQLFS